MTRILSIVPRGLFGKGGVETFCLALRARLQGNDGVKICFKATRGEEPTPLWAPMFIVRYLKICRALFSGRFDALHLNVSWGISSYRKILIVLACRLAGVPVVSHVHAGGLERVVDQKPLWFRALGVVLKKSDKTIVLGQKWKNELSRIFAIPIDKFVVIPNGIPDFFLGQTRTLTFQDGVPRLLFLGEVGPRKGADIFLRSLKQLKALGEPFTAIIAGNGDLGHYRKLAVDLGVADRVSFPGWVNREQSFKLLLESDLFVLPTTHENLPMSVVEALCAGCAVVTTHAGVMDEFLNDSENAMVVRPLDDEVTTAVLQLLRNDALRGKIQNGARETYLSLFTPEKTLDRVVAELISVSR